MSSIREREPNSDPGPVDDDRGSTKVGRTTRSIPPSEVWALLQAGQARLLDLRTDLERRRYGAPPGAVPVSFAKETIKPAGEGAIYLCQHAARSKLTLRAGAAEVAGGFVVWRRAGLPVQTVESAGTSLHEKKEER